MRHWILLILICCQAIIGHKTAYSQHITDSELGTSIIDFLMTNPRKANPSIQAQATTLGLINNLYQTNQRPQTNSPSEEEYISYVDINYRYETDVPSKIVRDKDGNAYLIFRGKKYSISRQLIYQAISVPGQSNMFTKLPPYEMDILKEQYYDNALNASCIFTCNGYTDRDQDGGISLEECSGIKRSFNRQETLYIAYKYNNQPDLNTSFDISVYKESNNERVRYREFLVTDKDDNRIKFLPYKPPIDLEPGIYLIEVGHKFLKKNGKTAKEGAFIRRERFEIME